LISQISSSGDPDVRATLSQKDTGRECQNTPLVLALKKGMDTVALNLIHTGADPDERCRNGETALHWAAMLRKNDVIQSLVEVGAQINAVNKFGRTACEYYLYNIQHIDMANPINEKTSLPKCLNANLTEFSDLYFHVAETLPSKRMSELQRLIKSRNETGVDDILVSFLTAQSEAGHTLEEQHELIVEQQSKIARQYAAKIDPARDLYEGTGECAFWDSVFSEIRNEKEKKRFTNAPLSQAFMNLDREKMGLLLQSCSREQVNAPSHDGFVALHWAAMLRNNALIQQLLDLGADTTIRTHNGWTAKDYYEHQICLADFKDGITTDEYKSLSKSYPHLGVEISGPIIMPEFTDVYSRDVMRHLGVPRRIKQFEQKILDSLS